MKTTIRTSESRGRADFGWLKATYSFSFSRWFDPDRVNFGALRVLNDDIVKGGAGFGTHPHDNMEIISIPLEGAVAHKDSMGSSTVIKANDIQVMTAGTGITHSEFNPNHDQDLKMLQIWIIPREKGLEPSYAQRVYKHEDRVNKLQLIASPDGAGESLTINQDAWLNRIALESGKSFTYDLQGKGSGVYLFLISGELVVDDKTLNQRDAIEITDTSSFTMEAKANSEILLIEVPMD